MYKENTKITRLINKKRKLLKRWRKNGRISDKLNANKLNQNIRKSIYQEQKEQIRRKIRPGNSKTLWEAFKIASDKEIIQIPNLMTLDDETFTKEKLPEAFAKYFNDKTENLATTCTIDQNIYNGVKILEEVN